MSKASKGCEFVPESALLDLCSVQLRKGSRNMLCLSFQVQTLVNLVPGCPLGVDSFTLRDSHCPLVCLVWCSENLGHAGCWFLHMQTAHPLGWRLQKWLDRNVGYPSFVARVLLAVARSQGNCLSFSFFWLSFGSDSGLWEGNIFWGCLILPEIFTVSSC